jgi:hypothetical protein
VASLFSYHALRPLTAVEERAVLAGMLPPAHLPPDHLTAGILAMSDRVRALAADPASGVEAPLSLRQLARVVSHAARFPSEVAGAASRALLLRFMPPHVRALIAREMNAAGLPLADTAATTLLRLEERDDVARVGDTEVARRHPAAPALVPSISFVAVPQHVALLREMAQAFVGGSHLLLIGNQGVGKNKLADRFLMLLRGEREYIQARDGGGGG